MFDDKLTINRVQTRKSIFPRVREPNGRVMANLLRRSLVGSQECMTKCHTCFSTGHS